MKPHRPFTQPSDHLAHLLRALRHRNYRLFFAGQGVSLIGTWMTRVATSWLVYRLSGSILLLGVVGFAGQIPAFFVAPLGGVLVDRGNRRQILVATQIVLMLQAFALAGLALVGVITVWQILLLSIVQGVANAFDIPARQAFVIEMVEDPADLGNAIALNSSIFNGARLIGPPIAGALIAVVGEGWCFLIDGISYLAVIVALLAMQFVPRPRAARPRSLLQQLTAGMRYAYRSAPIKSVLLLVALVSLMGMPYAVLMPVVAREILHGTAHTFGWLMGASGLGAVAGSLYLASRRSVAGLGGVIAWATGWFGIGLIAFGCSRALWLSLPLMLMVGFGMLAQMAASNTVLQTIVEEDKRGLVMSFYAMAFMGMAPFGSLLAGTLAHQVGVANTLVIGGVACGLGALAFLRELPELQRILRAVETKVRGPIASVSLAAPPEE